MGQGVLGSKAGARSLAGGKVQLWQDSVAILDGVTCRHPQTAYAGLQKSLYQEWAFMQRVTPYIGMAVQMVEDVLWDIFIPSLFQGATSQISGRAITGLLFK